MTLSSLPDSTPAALIVGTGDMTLGEIRDILSEAGEPVYITTKEASKRYSRSPRWWCEAAKDIPGAYKDRRWRLPVQGCEEHLARLTRPKPSRRGPWKEAAPASSVGPGSPNLQAR